MNCIKKHIAVFLLFTSSLFIIPKELVHEFSCHADTIDLIHCANSSDAVGNIHHHCDILQVFISPFSDTNSNIDFSAICFITAKYNFSVIDFSFDVFRSLEIRGPPAISLLS
ncbi:MAG: hypothetical protein ACHQNT_00200 [Bacteroidia bacterium]